jgi:signal transduction histidine kinase
MIFRLTARWRRWSDGRIPAVLAGAVLCGSVLTVVLALGAWFGAVSLAWSAPALLATLLLGAAAFAGRYLDRERERVRRALAAGVSHDIRTPLAQIGMFTEMLLLDRHGSEEERRRWLLAIERETARLGHLTENVLLFIHGAERAPYLARRPIDLGALVEDVAVGCLHRAQADQMTVDVDPPAGIFVNADPQAIRQLVLNLLDNALLFGPRGQSVAIELREEGGKAVLTVRDEGPALPHQWEWPTAVDSLDAADAGERGRGLGMAVAKQIVRSHGGRCRMCDCDGGVETVVTLPAVAPPAPEDASASSHHGSGRLPAGRQPAARA